MKVLISDRDQCSIEIDLDHIPRIGEYIKWHHYNPPPEVDKIVWVMEESEIKVDVIIYVK